MPTSCEGVGRPSHNDAPFSGSAPPGRILMGRTIPRGLSDVPAGGGGRADPFLRAGNSSSAGGSAPSARAIPKGAYGFSTRARPLPPGARALPESLHALWGPAPVCAFWIGSRRRPGSGVARPRASCPPNKARRRKKYFLEVALIERGRGNSAQAKRLLRKALRGFKREGDVEGLRSCLVGLGWNGAFLQGTTAPRFGPFRKAAALARRSKDDSSLAYASAARQAP